MTGFDFSNARECVLATRNAGKLRELRQMTAARGIVWRGLDEFPDVDEAPEPGRTFAENARHKAIYYAQRTGLPALADDSGLEVDALSGAPGVDSAHFAGPARDDRANNAKLVSQLRDVPPERRTARFRCHMALAVPVGPLFSGASALPTARIVSEAKIVAESEGVVEGHIVLTPRGSNGFGYDPHFELRDRPLTTAELPPAEKNAVSHRGQALRAMLAQLGWT